MKKLFMLLAMAALPFAIQAQTKYHDVEANDAKGPVKSITQSMMGNTQVTTFTQDGKMEQAGMKNAVYDENGYLQSAEIDAQGMTIPLKFTWENGKVQSQSTSMMGQQVTTTYVYNEKGDIIKQQIDMGGQKMEIEFSDYKYDDRGNWISRKTSMMGQQIESPRTIEYY